MSNRNYIELLNPSGRAYQSNDIAQKVNNVFTKRTQRIIDYAQRLNDELFPINDNFNLKEWEKRYNITPTPMQTVEERTAIVKRYMTYPKGFINRLALTFIQQQLDESRFFKCNCFL